MTKKERIDQFDESVVKTPLFSGWAEGTLAEELKKPSRRAIPSSYKSWESSSLSKWSHRDVEYVYGEWKHDIVWAVLVDYSYYPGGWCWMEYWVKLFVKRWDKTDMKRIVYRDSYSAARDDWWKAYTSIEWIEVHWDEVRVKVSSSRRTDTYTFYLEESKESEKKEEVLSPAEQAKFKEYFESEKDRLLKQETRDWRYPVCYDFALRQVPGAFGSYGVQPYDERPYDKAEIIDKYVDIEWWTACIVIKTQIDADAADGKQFKWLKYSISLKWGTILLETDQAYQSQLKSGKHVTISAS